MRKHRQPLVLLIFERIHKIDKLMEPKISYNILKWQPKGGLGKG
jgi:hypothetical protein